ncbi:MAG: ParB/RepB/Spo0J family partition protein [Firmicutes bacterium]|nr:ParB/RepB/Spo0J family partition protein [Bacillota bacterium]
MRRSVDPRIICPTAALGDMIGSIRSMVNTIRTEGFDFNCPLQVLEYQESLYVIDGHHRLIAALLLAISEVPIDVLDELPWHESSARFVQGVPKSLRYDYDDLWGKAL